MVQSAAKSVPEYLASLPSERRAVIDELRRLILENLPPGYEERMAFGMASYEIPLARYPDTYNRQPLCYLAFAAQKNGYSLYLIGPYLFGEERARKFREEWERRGKKLDMGKSCVRFKRIEDLALDVLADEFASIPVDDYIRQYEIVRSGTAAGKRKAKAKPDARKGSNEGKKPASRAPRAGAGKRPAKASAPSRAKSSTVPGRRSR
jgi:hypothetical protein